MAHKPYVPPVLDLMVSGGGDDGGDATLPESQNAPFNPNRATYSAWKLEVENSGMQIDSSYEGYLKWMTENGFAAYIHDEDS